MRRFWKSICSRVGGVNPLAGREGSGCAGHGFELFVGETMPGRLEPGLDVARRHGQDELALELSAVRVEVFVGSPTLAITASAVTVPLVPGVQAFGNAMSG